MRTAFAAAVAALLLASPLAGQDAQVRAEVSAVADSGATRVEVRLTTAPGVGAVASFQGIVQLPAGTPPVAAGEFPAGIVGAWNEVEPGRVRFAGVATQGLTQPLVLVLRVPGALAGETVRVALEEAVGADGFRKLNVGRPAPSHPMEDE